MRVAAALRCRAASAAVAAGALLAVPLRAAERPQGEERYHLGPVWVTPSFRFHSGVDTNVFRTLGAPVEDRVMVASPRLRGFWPVVRRLRLRGLVFGDFNYYQREGEERSVDFYGEGSAELDAGPFTAFGGGGGGRLTQRVSIDVDERLDRQEKRAHAGLTWRPGRRLSATGQVSGEVLTYAPGRLRLGGEIKAAMDRNTLTGTGQIRYALTPRTTLLASGDALEDRFFSQPPSVPRQRRSYRALGGVELSERAAVAGRLLIGVRNFPGTLAQGSPPYTGPVGIADLTLPLRAVRLRAEFERDVSYASSLVAVGSLRYRNAFILERYNLEAAVGLPFRLLGVASAGFSEARYLLPYPYPRPSILSSRTDHLWTGSATVVRRVGESLRMGGYLSRARRVSSLPLFSYEDTRYGFTMEILP